MLIWLEFWIFFMGSNYDPIRKICIAIWMKFFGRSVVVAEGMGRSPPLISLGGTDQYKYCTFCQSRQFSERSLGNQIVTRVWKVLSDCISLFIVVKFFSRILSVDVGFSTEPHKSCVCFSSSLLYFMWLYESVCALYLCLL